MPSDLDVLAFWHVRHFSGQVVLHGFYVQLVAVEEVPISVRDEGLPLLVHVMRVGRALLE